MLINEIKNIDSSSKELKKFALTIGIVLLIISAVMFYYSSELRIHFGIAGVLVIILGYIFPIVLLPFQKIWMGIALIMGFFMSRLILTLLFFLVITPIGIISGIFKKDFLDLTFNKSSNSYWNIRDKKLYQKIDSERQF